MDSSARSILWATSSWNSTRHGLLSKRLPPIYGQGKKHFARLLTTLEPVGTLEEVLGLVAWLRRSLKNTGGLVFLRGTKRKAFSLDNPFGKPSVALILRYQMTINRQLFQAINELERLQRLRWGDVVPAPLNLQVLGDSLTVSEKEHSDR